MSPGQPIKNGKIFLGGTFLVLLTSITGYYFVGRGYQVLHRPTSLEVEKQYYHSPIRFLKNPGLPRILKPVRDQILNQKAHANILFLIVTKPKVEINWSDFSDIKKRFLEIQSNDEDVNLGHVQWAWSCRLQNTQHEGASGFNGDQTNSILKNANAGWGMTSAVMNYHDGYFEPPWAVHINLVESNPADIKLLAVVVDEKSCEQFLNTYEKIIFDQRLYKFRLLESPAEDRIEGENCSTVALKLFEQVQNFPLEVFNSAFTEWRVPSILIGYGDTPLPKGAELPLLWKKKLFAHTKTPVGLKSVLMTSTTTKEFVNLKFLDPQLIFKNLNNYPSTVWLEK